MILATTLQIIFPQIFGVSTKMSIFVKTNNPIMKSEKRIVIIYLPDGNQMIYTTSQAVHESDHNYQLARSIIFEGPDVTVAIDKDNDTVVKMYYNMQYSIEIWNS